MAEIENTEPKVIIGEEQVEVEPKALTKTELLRELSKELGIDAFKPEELKKKFNEFTTWQTDQLTEQDRLQVELGAYKAKEAGWQTTVLEYESKLKASELGISTDKIEDALKLAGGDPSKFADVLKKYPSLKGKGNIAIGLTDPHKTTAPTDRTELEAYMAENPMYKNYRKK